MKSGNYLPRGVWYSKSSNVYAGLLLVVMIVATTLAWIFGPDSHKRQMTPDPQKIVFYPGAQHMQEKANTPELGFEPNRIISFDTSDSPELVLAFYEDRMVNDGWHLLTVNEETLAFTFNVECGRGCTKRYKVWVIAKKLSGGITSVEIDRFY